MSCTLRDCSIGIILLVCHLASFANANLRTFATCLEPLTAHQAGSALYSTLLSKNHVVGREFPVAIVLASDSGDVSRAVWCASKASLGVCARSGGHARDGRTGCNGGVMIDLSLIRHVKVEGNSVASIGAGATLGETLWALYARGRWFAAGVCPSVGVGGYLLGGGHGPYEGRLGLGCDSIKAANIVLADGKVTSVSKTRHKELFWALCGSGGASFGIVTEFQINTAAATIFDRAVVFRYWWPVTQSGELLKRFINYEAHGGYVWVRMSSSAIGGGFFAQGVCYNVFSATQCISKLEQASFFNTQGRKKVFVEKARNALDVAAFFGPEGWWGNRLAPDLWFAFNNQRYMDSDREWKTDQSFYLSFKAKKPSTAFWQLHANYCCDATSLPKKVFVCQINLMGNAVRSSKQNAFPHRAATVSSHFTISKATDAEKVEAYQWMKTQLAPYTIGSYVNYQDRALNNSYAQLYWGNNLPRLREVKTIYDKNSIFANPQPILPY